MLGEALLEDGQALDFDAIDRTLAGKLRRFIPLEA